MLILVEGPDGTGKTSLIKSLMSRAVDQEKEVYERHLTSKTIGKEGAESFYKEFLRELTEAHLNTNLVYILDRAWVSNIVYTHIYEPEKKCVSKELTEALFSVTDEFYLCLPENREAYLNNFTKLASTRAETYPENADKVYDEFAKFKTRENVCIWDIFGKDKKEPDIDWKEFFAKIDNPNYELYNKESGDTFTLADFLKKFNR